MQAVELQVRSLALPFPKSRSIDGDNTLPIKFENNINAIPSGSGDFTHNHAFRIR